MSKSTLTSDSVARSATLTAGRGSLRRDGRVLDLQVERGLRIVLLGFPAALVAVLLALPRYHHFFPSMIDDWYAIAQSPDQVRELLRGGSPEPMRYRPGLAVWSALQWHTFGAPNHAVAPIVWNVVRTFVFTVGVAAFGWLLTEPASSTRGSARSRAVLVALLPLALVTVPGFAVDLTRFETQEPLLVGLTAAGAVLVVAAVRSILRGDRPRVQLGLGLAGLALWTFGVLQKETSLALLLAAPFLVMLRPSGVGVRSAWRELDGPKRRAVVVLGATGVLPLGLMVFWTARIVAAGPLIYGAKVRTDHRLLDAVDRQISLAAGVLGTFIGTALFMAVVVAGIGVVVKRRRVDWLSLGLLAVAAGFLVFAAESGVVTSRYFLPSVALLALVLARLVSWLGIRAMYSAAILLALASLVQLPDARREVQTWAAADRGRADVIRDTAARSAGGCRVDATGTDSELVLAFPILLPLVSSRANGCVPPQRFVAVFGGSDPGRLPNSTTGCAPATEVATFGRLTPTAEPVATVFRCSG